MKWDNWLKNNLKNCSYNCQGFKMYLSVCLSVRFSVGPWLLWGRFNVEWTLEFSCTWKSKQLQIKFKCSQNQMLILRVNIYFIIFAYYVFWPFIWKKSIRSKFKKSNFFLVIYTLCKLNSLSLLKINVELALFSKC